MATKKKAAKGTKPATTGEVKQAWQLGKSVPLAKDQSK